MAIEPPHISRLTDWRPLARGGFAVVWEARQETLDRLVAVKVDQRRLDIESERLRFLREAGAAGRMSGHAGIVTVHDAGILPDDRPYLVMELYTGGSLTQYVESSTRLSQQRVRAIGVRIADALAATHARGVLHRDVKPANILVDAYDQVGLADFGLAALPGPGLASQETFQALTPAYTAPEILRRQPPTASADVYSLAATLYALLSGRAPRWPDTPTPTLVEVLKQQQRPLTPLPDVEPGFMRVLQRALSLDARDRPSAAEFRDELAALQLSEPETAGAPAAAAVAPVPAPPPRPDRGDSDPRSSPPAAPPARRRSVLASLVGLALLAVLVTALILGNRGAVTASPAPASSPAVSDPAQATLSPSTAPSSAAPSSAAPSSPAPSSPAASSAAPSSPAPSSPAPSTAAPSSPAASPSRAVVPAGFKDCSDRLGGDGYCPTVQECWAGVISVFDLPSLGTRQDCAKTHVYQTFAAGTLDASIRRQSQLEDDPEVKRLCRASQLDKLLASGDRGKNWEILALPPQEADGSDEVFRCLFGRGDRGEPVPLS